ncbi:hypothetical protein ACUSIJ_02580 [Pseudochelatococcus sp. B33]
MSDVNRLTPNINGSLPHQNPDGTPHGAADDKTLTVTTFIGDQQRSVTVGKNPVSVRNSRTIDSFASAFEDAARKVASDSGPVVRLPSRETKDTSEAEDIGELQHIAGPTFDGDHAAETAILTRHIARLDLPEAAKGAALNFLQQAIAMQANAMPANAIDMQAIIDTINRVEAGALKSGEAGAEVLRAIFIDGPLDDNTKTIVKAILNKASETHALRTDQDYRALHDAIKDGQVTERMGSPASSRNRSQRLVNALTRLGHDIPDNLRADLLRHFKP